MDCNNKSFRHRLKTVAWFLCFLNLALIFVTVANNHLTYRLSLRRSTTNENRADVVTDYASANHKRDDVITESASANHKRDNFTTNSASAKRDDVVMDFETANHTSSLSDGLIFNGGAANSGSDLLEFLLVSHPSISCTNWAVGGVTSNALGWFRKEVLEPFGHGIFDYAALKIEDLQSHMARLIEALITEDKGQSLRIKGHRYCQRSRDLMLQAPLLAQIFPDARFLLLVRDGRAVAVTRRLRSRDQSRSYLTLLQDWSNELDPMVTACDVIGPDRCYVIHYEQLILDPYGTLRSILAFLNIPWIEDISRHPDLVRPIWGTNCTSDSEGTPVDPGTIDQQIMASLPQWQLHSLFGWMPIGSLAGTLAIQSTPLLTRLGYDKVRTLSDYILKIQDSAKPVISVSRV